MRKPTQDSSEIVVLGDINADVIGRVESWPEPGQEEIAKRFLMNADDLRKVSSCRLTDFFFLVRAAPAARARDLR